MKTVLVIAGSDPTGGAGVQSDILTIYQNNAYAFSVVTSITSQNANGLIDRNDVSLILVKSQLEALLTTYLPDAIKIGMLGNHHICKGVFEVLSTHYPLEENRPPIVIDPVMMASSGHRLLEEDAIAYLIKTLFPMASLLTPNLMEYQSLVQYDSFNELECPILVKGGHMDGACVDTLLQYKEESKTWTAPRHEVVYDHGTGCTLSSAIAANLANGQSLQESIGNAKSYLTKGLKNPIQFDGGYGTIRK